MCFVGRWTHRKPLQVNEGGGKKGVSEYESYPSLMLYNHPFWMSQKDPRPILALRKHIYSLVSMHKLKRRWVWMFLLFYIVLDELSTQHCNHITEEGCLHNVHKYSCQSWRQNGQLWFARIWAPRCITDSCRHREHIIKWISASGRYPVFILRSGQSKELHTPLDGRKWCKWWGRGARTRDWKQKGFTAK